MKTQPLQDFFQFNESDLEANRGGKFSTKQIELLKESGGKLKKEMRWNGIVLLLVAAVGPALAIGIRSFGWFWILGWGFGWTLIWGLLGWGFIEGSLDRPKFQLGIVQGPIRIGTKEGYDSKQHKAVVWNDLRVGKKRFEIQTDLTAVLNFGDEYIVYYEKSEGKIVALEFVSSAHKEELERSVMSSVDYQEQAKKLQRHFGFDEVDLMANQNGYLSEKQKKTVNEYSRGGRGIAWFLGSALLIGAVAMAKPTFGWMSGVRGISNYIEKGFTIGSGLFMWAIFLFLSIAGIILIVVGFTSMPQYELQSIRGRANLVRGSTGGRHSSVYYDLNISGKEFDGDGSLNKIIIQDAEYIVYYTAGAQQIVSIELVADQGR